MLTAKQKKVLEFIKLYYAEHGIAPSFMEMMAATGFASKSGIYRVLVALEERGHIRRMRDRARAIELIPDPHLLLSLHQISDFELAKECQRRGFSMGRWELAREKLGTGFIEVMHFRELAPKARHA